MVIVWGKRLAGKTDTVPGLCHVATEFFHLYYLPLIPLGSHIITNQSGLSWRGVPTRLSLKSIVAAWFRCLSFILALLGTPILVFGVAEGSAGAVALGAIGPVLFALSLWLPTLRRASAERAAQLAAALGLSPSQEQSVVVRAG